jgi:hypothetical protein
VLGFDFVHLADFGNAGIVGAEAIDFNLRLSQFGASEGEVMGRALRSPLSRALMEKIHCIHRTHMSISILNFALPIMKRGGRDRSPTLSTKTT